MYCDHYLFMCIKAVLVVSCIMIRCRFDAV